MNLKQVKEKVKMIKFKLKVMRNTYYTILIETSIFLNLGGSSMHNQKGL